MLSVSTQRWNMAMGSNQGDARETSDVNIMFWIWGGAPPAAISSVAKYFRALFLNSSSVLSCHYTSFAPCAKKIMKHFFNKLQLASKIMSDKSWGPWMLFVVCPSKIFPWQPARSRHHVQLLCQWLSCLHGCVPMMKNVYTTCFLLIFWIFWQRLFIRLLTSVTFFPSSTEYLCM